MPQATETRRITINVDAGQTTPQLKAIADQLSGMNKNTKSLADSFGFLSSLSGTFLGGLGVQQLIAFSDQIQNLNNRLLALTGDQETATDLLHKLQQAARDTNSSLQDTSDLFTRLSIALKAANVDSSVMIDFTKTLVNTFRLSGSSAEEAASKVTSLAYAMQQGGLRGRELRTILRENTELGNILKQTFGGNLLQAANNGFITTAKLFEVIRDNMDDVNTRANTLSATFSQSLTKVFDAFKVKIFELNQALGASGGFASVTQYAIDHMNTLIAILGVLVASTLPLLISQMVRLAASFGLLNPAVAVVTALAVALLSVNPAIANSLGPIDQMQLAIFKLDITLVGFINRIAYFGTYIPGVLGKASSLIKFITDRDLANSNKQIDLLLSKAQVANDKAKEAGDSSAASVDKWKNSISSLSKIKFDENPFQILAKLNAAFDAGIISIAQYNERIQSVDLSKMRKEFETGHADLEKLNEAHDKFNTYQLNTQLRDGVITLREYDTAIRDINLDKLNRQLAAGSISLEEYNTKIASVSDKFSTNGAFRTGLQDYLNAIGTTTQQVAEGITHAFKNVEDSFISFIKTGTFNFAKFTQDILDDLLRIIVRATIIAPLAQGILSVIPTNSAAGTQAPASNANYSNVAAHGAYFDGSVSKFAGGGIFDSPTGFSFGKNKRGVLGEAGPEAILPLTRDNGGDLGVKASVTPVNINIINNNGSDISQTESTGPNGDKQIDIIITNKVREGIGSGKFDKAFKQSYGLNRRGS